MYDENEVAADEKIAGWKVEVTGVVQSIDKDFTGSIVVLLKSDNNFMPARFGMEETIGLTVWGPFISLIRLRNAAASGVTWAKSSGFG